MSTGQKWFVGVGVVIALGALVLIVFNPSAPGNWLTLVAMVFFVVSQVLQARRGGGT